MTWTLKILIAIGLLTSFAPSKLRAETFAFGAGTVSAVTSKGITEVDAKDLHGTLGFGVVTSISEARKQSLTTEYSRLTLFGQPTKHNIGVSAAEYFNGGNGWDIGVHGGLQFELSEKANTNLQFGFSGKRAISKKSNKWYGESGLIFTNIVDEADYATMFGRILFRLE